MGRPTFTARQVADCLRQIEQLTGRLRTLEPTVRQRATVTGRDGYPPTSGPDGGHGRGGDPVGNLVALRLDHPRGDILADTHADLCAKVHQARRLLDEAESACRRSLPPAIPVGEDACVSCARLGRWSPIHRTRRCSWCYSWATSQGGEDPPLDVLRLHHNGSRVTVRAIAALRRRKHG